MTARPANLNPDPDTSSVIERSFLPVINPAPAAHDIPLVTTPRSQWSLHGRLMMIAIIAVLMAWFAGGTAMFVAANEESDRLFDDRLQGLAKTVISFAEHEIIEIQNEGRVDRTHLETETTLGSRYQYQIWDKKGVLLLRSFSASETRPIAPFSQTGFGKGRWEMKEYRTYALLGPLGQFTIQVAESLEERSAVVGTLSGYFIVFLVASVAIVSLMAWLLLRSAMRAIDHSAAQLLSRTPNDLSQVTVDNPPAELVPMIGSINTLFARIEQTLSRERGFTATAAHELRTPLAALRLQAQVAARAKDPAERDAALVALMECVDRSSHLLDQLLALAKLDDLREGSARMQMINVQRLFDHLMLDIGHAAAEKELRFKAQFDAPHIYGIEAAVTMLLRNVISNSIKYTPESGSIHISTSSLGQFTELRIDDSGPGIAQSERERVLEPFYRLDYGRSQSAEGVGLGLAIVRAVAQAHKAQISLEEAPLGGLSVVIRFPNSSPQA
jgi:signal transduction histidine kinase